MKRMKKAVAFEASLPVVVVHEDARIRFKHQSLMQDYEELEKETESMKSKLQTMQQKRLILMAEVRFLRRRFKYLTEKQPITTPKQQAPKRGNNNNQKPQSHENRRSNNGAKGKKNSKKESVFRYPQTSLDLNQKDMNHSNAAVLEASPPIFFDLNQKARALDLNQLDRIHSGKEASKQKKNIPFFDLNQISGEEEDLQDHCEPLKGLLRSANNNNNSITNSGEEQQNNDMKLLACRSSENGPSRSGKRKITWQDQVALRV